MGKVGTPEEVSGITIGRREVSGITISRRDRVGRGNLSRVEMDLNVEPTGKTTATVVLTQEQVDTLRGAPGMARVPLAITFEGRTHRTSISRYQGKWMMVVNAAMRDAGLRPGATYRCEVERDDAPREVEIPDDLQDALTAAGVMENWQALSYTRRRELAGAVASAKRPETRAKRIGLAVDAASDE